MKKIIVALALFFAGVASTQAQVTFNPTIRGGLNFSNFTDGDAGQLSYNYDYNTGQTTKSTSQDVFSTTTNFYLGFAGALRLSKVYSLQPEVNYSNQGATAKIIYNPYTKVLEEGDFKVSYIGVQIMNKFHFKKFNVQVGPGLDFVTTKNFKTQNDVDLTFVFGAGFDITKNFGIEARYKAGIIPVMEVKQDVYNGYYYTGKYSSHSNSVFSLGAYYKFDIK